MHIKTLTLLFVLGSYFEVRAQDTEPIPPLVTDRPDVTESAAVVPEGTLQLESGVFFASSEVGGIKEERIGWNSTLFRYGIWSNLELRIGWSFEEIRTTSNGIERDNIQSGLSPLKVGTKVSIASENGLVPELALLGHLCLPFSAGNDFKPENTGVDFRIAASHTLTENSSLGYNLGATWGSDSPEAAYAYSVSFGYSISGCIGLYAEIYGDFPENSMANHYWDAGITYLLLNNLQLDATVGTGITEGQDLLLSAGLSYRIPK